MQRIFLPMIPLLALSLGACGGGSGGGNAGDGGDDDSPITLTFADVAAQESAGDIVFELTASRALDSDLLISVSSLNVSAIAGSDYTPPADSITLPAGETRLQIGVPLIDDAVVEDSETFTLKLSIDDPRVGTSSLELTGTIENDDQVGLSVSSEAVVEGNPLSFTLQLVGSSAIPLSVDYASADGSAAAGDYSGISGQLLFAPGDTQATLEVGTIDDPLLEGEETFSLQLSNPSAGMQLSGHGEGRILDDDRVSLELADRSMDEGNVDGELVFQVTLVGSAAIPVSADFATLPGSATAGEDYRHVSDTLTIAAGSSSAEIRVPVIGDERAEGAETFQLQLSDATAGVDLPAAPATGTLLNDDGLVLSAADAGVDEGQDGSQQLNVTLSLDTAGTIDHSFHWTTVENSARAGSDYQTRSGDVIIPAGQLDATITVPIVGDRILESDETFFIELSSPSTDLNFARNQIPVTIRNDDSVQLSVAPASASEDSGTLDFAISLDHPAAFALEFDVSAIDGSTSGGDDFAAPAASLSIPAGDQTAQISISPVADSLLESDESFTLQLTPKAGLADVSGDSASGTIEDDDSVTLTASANPASEADGTLQYQLQLDRAAAVALRLSYVVSGGSATDGEDFTAASGELEIPAGNSSATLDVALIDNAVVEGDETISLALTAISGGLQIDAAPVAATIEDDDSVTVTVTTLGAAENDGELVFNISLDAAADIDLSLGYASVDNSALAGEDYTAVSDSLLIAAGSTTGEIRVSLIDDGIVELDEQFDLQLTPPASGMALAANPVAGPIRNDDQYALSVSSPSVTEGDAAVLGFDINLDQAAVEALTVHLDTADGSATAGSDYTALSGATLVIAAGSSAGSVEVAVLDDSDSEPSETLSLNVELRDAGGTALISASGEGTIVDDELIGLSITGLSVPEGNTGSATALLTVSRSRADELVNVDYATDATGATATEGVDYSATSGTLVFGIGESEKQISVDILGDLDSEDDERFAVQLSAPSANATLVSDRATVTINDDDGGNRLNDTGVALCAVHDDTELACDDAAEGTDQYPGQDGEHGRDARFNDDSDGTAGFSFTKLDADGDPMPASTNEGNFYCVRDNVTGLVWESKQRNGLHDQDDTFSWYQSDPKQNGNDAGTLDGGDCADLDDAISHSCDTEGFVNAVNQEALCGYTDWRLPTVMELRSLVDLSTSNLSLPAIDDEYFPLTDGHNYPAEDTRWRYWTGLPKSSSATGDAWVVAFDDGHETPSAKSNSQHLRLVRGGNPPVTDTTAADGRCNTSIAQTTPPSRFNINLNVEGNEDTVEDTWTGLTWKRCLEGRSGSTCAGNVEQYTWQGTLQRVAQINAAGGFAGQTDWRVPNAKEMASILERSCVAPAFNDKIFPSVPSGLFVWSSTPNHYITNVSTSTLSYAWTVSTHDGNDYRKAKNASHLLWLVRGD